MDMSGLKVLFRVPLVLLVYAVALLGSGGSIPSGFSVSQAQARIGRPAMPMSYAGVTRRTTRRAAYGAAAGAAAAGTYYYSAAPGCQQVVNSYGQIVYRCP
jgi:hypothetical protein